MAGCAAGCRSAETEATSEPPRPKSPILAPRHRARRVRAGASGSGRAGGGLVPVATGQVHAGTTLSQKTC